MRASSWLRNSRGEWYVIAQAALMLGVLIAPATDLGVSGRAAAWSGTSLIVGGLLCVVGLGFAVLGSVGLGRKNLSPFPKPRQSSTLIEGGPFSLVRHPIYTGLSLCAFGWAVGWNSIAALIAAFALLVFFDAKARREERWLEEQFEGYRAYRRRVKKLIPFVY
jgi:protein-S-isoprenylcysteine O-methyltransferase Ste14